MTIILKRNVAVFTILQKFEQVIDVITLDIKNEWSNVVQLAAQLLEFWSDAQLILAKSADPLVKIL